MGPQRSKRAREALNLLSSWLRTGNSGSGSRTQTCPGTPRGWEDWKQGKSLTGEWSRCLTWGQCPDHSGPRVCSVKYARSAYFTPCSMRGQPSTKAKARTGVTNKWHVWPTLPLTPRAGIADRSQLSLPLNRDRPRRPSGCRTQSSHHQSIPASKCEKSDLLSPHWGLCLFCLSLRAAGCVVGKSPGLGVRRPG